MYNNQKLKDIKEYISEGICGVKLKNVYEVPDFKIQYKETYPMQYDIYQATFHIIHEINTFMKKYTPETVYYWFEKFVKDETDMETFIGYDKAKKYNAVIPDIKKSGGTYIHDISYSNRLFRKDIRKDDRFDLFENITYAFCIDTLKFNIFEPIFMISNEKNLIMKYPTITGRIVYDSLILYSYLSSTSYLVKLKQDSFIKDSFILYCINIDHEKLSSVKRNFEKYISYTEIKNKKVSSIFISNVLKNEDFKKILIEFSKKVQMSTYLSLSFILESIEKDTDIDSDYCKNILNLLNPKRR